jgi:hypothetical protein
MNDIEAVFAKIAEVQDSSWNGKCTKLDCYWNMWNPKNYPEDSQCTSESLADTRMIPNTCQCPSYWSYAVACGHNKGEVSP